MCKIFRVEIVTAKFCWVSILDTQRKYFAEFKVYRAVSYGVKLFLKRRQELLVLTKMVCMFVTSFSFNCFAHNYLIFYIFKHKETLKIKNTVFEVNNTRFLGFRSSHLGTHYCFVTSISPYSAYLTFS